ncbi:MAG: DUF177 domain-containing protein [Balneolaceae bacterium]|nr:MAG: DUF177 domain-containing protein [Balneolaceae bacterium]
METDKLIFNLHELPNGASSRQAIMGQDELVLEKDIRFIGAVVDVNFYKTNHFIEVKLKIKAETELICDRSLNPFIQIVHGTYHILFEPDPVEESDTDKGAVKRIPHGDLQINISQEVRDTILLNVPFKKIHPDFFDSEGNLTEFETKYFGHDAVNNNESIDPRWAALKKLK